MTSASGFAFAALIGLSSVGRAEPRYSVRAIETPQNVDIVDAVSLNDRGEVAGTLVRYNRPNEAFFWDGSGPARVLPVDYGHGTAINNRGEVVGFSNDGAFLWSADGGLRILSPPAGYTEFQPFDINDDGTTAGLVYGDSGGITVRRRADGTIDTLPGISFTGWSGDTINGGGAIVGTIRDAPRQVGAGVWEPGGAFRLLPSGSTANAINDRGEVAGTWFDGKTGGTAFFRADGTLARIPDMPGAEVSSQTPYGINNAGVVVGYLNRSDHSNDAFLWTEADGTLDLQDLLDGSGADWELEFALDVNETGQIIGRGIYDGRLQGFLLTPVPEPRVLGLCVPLLAATLLRRRSSGAANG